MKLSLLMNSVRSRVVRTIAFFGILAGTLAPVRAEIAPVPVFEPYGAPAVDSMIVVPTVDLDGRSDKLRFRLAMPSDALFEQLASVLTVDSAMRATPGVHALTLQAGGDYSVITLRPFDEKKGAWVDKYRVGFWPAEKRKARSMAYANPEGFIHVTERNQDTYVSEHFQLRDFLTHDQTNVWPKALVLREELIDKLELVIADLNAHGVSVSHMKVLSGFRTPQYNQQGVGRGGRAQDSRHQFGDAADVFVDNNRDGRMDDLNRDGKVNLKDVRVILAAVERVDRAHPELLGGFGTYKATGAHGPFAHIDTRGARARWGA